MPALEIIGLIILGIIAGVASGILGIGGAIIIIPALVLIFAFDQQTAQGTTLFLMVFPIGIMAALEYYRAGKINIVAGLIIAGAFVIGGYLGGKLAVDLNPSLMRKIFSVFLVAIAVRMFFD